MLISSEINLPRGLRVQAYQILIAFTINILVTVITYFALCARDVLVFLSWLASSEFGQRQQEENVTRSLQVLNHPPRTFVTWGNQLLQSANST